MQPLIITQNSQKLRKQWTTFRFKKKQLARSKQMTQINKEKFQASSAKKTLQ